MKLLIDTHIFLWIFSGKKISDDLRGFFENFEDNQFYLSHVAAWEISIKYGLGKLYLPETPELFIPERVRRSGFSLLPIDLRHVLQVHSLPHIHRDLFDRLLISQGKTEDMTILSEDPVFKRYKIKTLKLQDLY